jgi:hypothetical protein
MKTRKLENFKSKLSQQLTQTLYRSICKSRALFIREDLPNETIEHATRAVPIFLLLLDDWWFPAMVGMDVSL